MGPAEAAGRLRLENRLDSGIALVTVTGEIDVSTSALLREHLLRVITDEPRRGLVVNLARVSFIDSTGTGVLVGIWHRVRATEADLMPRGKNVCTKVIVPFDKNDLRAGGRSLLIGQNNYLDALRDAVDPRLRSS